MREGHELGLTVEPQEPHLALPKTSSENSPASQVGEGPFQSSRSWKMEVEGGSVAAVSSALAPLLPSSSLGSDVRGSSLREKGWESGRDHLHCFGNQRPIF